MRNEPCIAPPTQTPTLIERAVTLKEMCQRLHIISEDTKQYLNRMDNGSQPEPTTKNEDRIVVCYLDELDNTLNLLQSLIYNNEQIMARMSNLIGV